MLSLLHIGYNILSVAVGMSEPRDWPHLFGSPLKGYTLRKCWGWVHFHKFKLRHWSFKLIYSRIWHQKLRKLMTGDSVFIAKKLRLPENTLTTCFKLFIAFFISGLIHHSAEYILHQKWAGHSMEFFLLQAVGITCEDINISLAVRAGFSS